MGGRGVFKVYYIITVLKGRWTAIILFPALDKEKSQQNFFSCLLVWIYNCTGPPLYYVIFGRPLRYRRMRITIKLGLLIDPLRWTLVNKGFLWRYDDERYCFRLRHIHCSRGWRESGPIVDKSLVSIRSRSRWWNPNQFQIVDYAIPPGSPLLESAFCENQKLLAIFWKLTFILCLLKDRSKECGEDGTYFHGISPITTNPPPLLVETSPPRFRDFCQQKSGWLGQIE